MSIEKIGIDLNKGRYIMGILNITPDSFSDGGDNLDLKHSKIKIDEMIKNGAEIIDIGGESTRPGYDIIDEKEEFNRIEEPLKYLLSKKEIIVSVDTSKEYVARKALENGVHIINDISGLNGSSKMAKTISEFESTVVIMANRRNISFNKRNNIIVDIINLLEDSLEKAIKSGIKRNKIIIDPGFGFGLKFEENYELLNRLSEIKKYFKCPLLMGTSRKSMFFKLYNTEPKDTLGATLSSTAFGVISGVNIFRVHDVKENYQCMKTSEIIMKKGIKWE